MSTSFPIPKERRYADFPRRWLVEYHMHSTRTKPDTVGRCATLKSARSHATDAIDVWQYKLVRIFDSKIGQYVLTYKASPTGILRYKNDGSEKIPAN